MGPVGQAYDDGACSAPFSFAYVYLPCRGPDGIGEVTRPTFAVRLTVSYGSCSWFLYTSDAADETDK